MGVEIDWKGDEFLKRFEAAAEVALDATTQDLAGIMETDMRTSITVAPGTAVKDQPPSAPGTPPASKSGNLAGSMTNAKVGRLRYAAGTNVSYARIHEFGGTFTHPGGWLMTFAPRPFMRPALNNNRKRLGGVFNAAFKKALAGGA